MSSTNFSMYCIVAVAALLGADLVRSPRANAPACSAETIGQADFTPARSYELVGAYDLTLVNSQGGYGDSVTTGVLELWLNDSARQYRLKKPGPPGSISERPLSGAYQRESPLPSGRTDPRASRDPNHPGVELHGRKLEMGLIDYLDGWSDDLTIVRADSSGFWGTWGFRGGLVQYIDTLTGRRVPDPGGHFCAIRRK